MNKKDKLDFASGLFFFLGLFFLLLLEWLSPFPLKLLCEVKVKLFSGVLLFATPWAVAYQAPQSMGFSRQEYGSGLPFPSLGDLPSTGIKPGPPALQTDALLSEPPGINASFSWSSTTLSTVFLFNYILAPHLVFFILPITVCKCVMSFAYLLLLIFPLDLGTRIMSVLFTALRYWLNAFETWNPFSHENLPLVAGFLS